MIPEDLHEWVSFEDPDESRTWVFDTTFLASSWRCVYGDGCQGIEAERAPEAHLGCCSHGAHFSDDADRKRVKKAAKRLTAEQWQHKPVADKKGAFAGKDHRRTRVVDGGCIFLNRPGFPGGPGCALHRAALDDGVEPLSMKPEVCWQLPVRRVDHDEEDGHVVSIVREWKRRDWGEGGAEFAWWCTEEPEAFVATEPVYRTNQAELTAMVGPKVFNMLASHLDRKGRTTLLPHPVVRRRG